MQLTHEGRSLDESAYIRTHRANTFELSLTSDNFDNIEHFGNRRELDLAWYFIEVPAGPTVVAIEDKKYTTVEPNSGTESPATAEIELNLKPGKFYLLETLSESDKQALFRISEYGDKYSIQGNATDKSVQRHYTGDRSGTIVNSVSEILCDPCSN
ncbi:MAG: hypothetical protein QNK34_03160 [Woeseiaceae bacterium]|nr:hypothetical protein [Woeseiaceae bacterium]